jgi:hypothetical protein
MGFSKAPSSLNRVLFNFFLPFMVAAVFDLAQAPPAVEQSLILHHIGEQFPHVPAPVALKKDAFRKSIQLQHRSSLT